MRFILFSILYLISSDAKKIETVNVLKCCENVKCFGNNVCQERSVQCQSLVEGCFEPQPFCDIQDYFAVDDVQKRDDVLIEETAKNDTERISTTSIDSLCNGVTCYGQNQCRVALTLCENTEDCRNYQPACIISNLEVNQRITRLVL